MNGELNFILISFYLRGSWSGAEYGQGCSYFERFWGTRFMREIGSCVVLSSTRGGGWSHGDESAEFLPVEACRKSQGVFVPVMGTGGQLYTSPSLSSLLTDPDFVWLSGIYSLILGKGDWSQQMNHVWCKPIMLFHLYFLELDLR